MIKYIYIFFIIGFLIVGCKEKASNKKEIGEKVEFNQVLANELKTLAEIDQIAAYIPQGEYAKLTEKQWKAFKDSVFTTHQLRISEIFDKHGFVGFDLAGKEGSENFWILVQHSDHNPEFQKKVLEKMKIEVDKANAKPSNYGLLVDRVNLNTGHAQIYGTQVDYDMEICRAFPKNLADSSNVNQRRKEIGLQPIEVYLNEMTEMNFEMNKEYYTEKGVSAPKLYKIKSVE